MYYRKLRKKSGINITQGRKCTRNVTTQRVRVMYIPSRLL